MSTIHEPHPTDIQLYRCKVCGTRWLLWPKDIDTGGWNLLDRWSRPGSCCDNAPMGDQLEHMRDLPVPSPLRAEAAPTPRKFPIHSTHRHLRASVPWSLVAPHAETAFSNHGQTLERLAERGGLALDELLSVLEDRRWMWVDEQFALKRIAEIEAAAESPRLPAAPAPWTRAQVEAEADYLQFLIDSIPPHEGAERVIERDKRRISMLRAYAQTFPATVPAPVAPLEYDCTTCGAHWVAVLPSRACPECFGLFIKKCDRSCGAPWTREQVRVAAAALEGFCNRTFNHFPKQIEMLRYLAQTLPAPAPAREQE